MKRLFLAIFSGIAAQTAAAVTPMIYGEAARLDGLDPYTTHETAARRLADLIFDDLIITTATGEYQGHLAASWQIETGGGAVTVKLRPQVAWQGDENPAQLLCAQDVVTTIRLLKAPSSQIPNRDRFQDISRAEALDNLTVRIVFSRALGDPLKSLIFKVLPDHKLRNIAALTRATEFVTAPIGTGPYRLAEVTAAGELRLKAHSRYFQGPPAIPEIVMKSFSDQSIMAQSLMYNSLDLMTYVSPRDLPEIIGDQKLSIIPYDALSFTFFAMNNRNPVLADRRVRQAISYAINRKEMLEAFFNNRGTLISGPFPPTSWAYNIEVKGFEYDPKRAEDLLDAAGNKKQGAKWLDAQGHPITLSFAVPIGQEGETMKRIALAFKNYLEAIGVGVDLQFMDWLVWKNKVLEKHEFDLTIASWSFDDASNITSLFHSGYAGPWGNNFVGYNNSDVDMMLTEAAATNDFDKRRAIYHKLHAILAEDAPYTYLWTLMHHAAHSRRLSGITIEPESLFKHITLWKKRGDDGQ